MIELAIFCLALNVYHEARGEPLRGQYAVAFVTINRAQKPEHVCHVVTQKEQFSWTKTLLTPVKGGYRLTPDGIPREPEAWERAVKVAEKSLYGKVQDFTKGSDHFHAIKARPYWRKKMEKVKVVGNHIFYRAGKSPATMIIASQ
jgi:N-acetylmuramoyl-L-alanine amidase